MDSKLCVVINLFVLMYVGGKVQCDLADIERSSRRLDELLVDVEALRYFGDVEKDFEIWQDLKYETGIGNREELYIANITAKIDPTLLESIDNYQLVNTENDVFLAGSNDHVLYFYQLDVAKGQAAYITQVNSAEKILTFKLLHLPNNSQADANADKIVVAILCVESPHGTNLKWYRFSGKYLVGFWSWPVQNRVKRVQFFQHERQNRLVLLKEIAGASLEQLYSRIDVYKFSLDGERHLWLSQEESVPKTFDLQVCPTYESTVMVLQQRNDVVIYEYEGKKNKEAEFRRHQNLSSNGLHNVICFESGYIRYLVTYGRQTALYDFFEGRFQLDSDAEEIFNESGEISWIQSIPVDTYREESILLVQLRNSTIIGMSWKGQGFERISQSDLNFGRLDLSRATVIPKYGFVYGNILVKIEVKLRERPRPVRDEMEKMLQTRQALAEVMRKQELILNETEDRINQSYLMHSDITGFWNITDLEVESVIIEDGVRLYDNIEIGGKMVTPSEFQSDLGEVTEILNDLESKLEEIKSNLADALPINSMESILTGDIVIDGGFDVKGTLSVSELNFELLNNFSLPTIMQDMNSNAGTEIIEGEKLFESINADYLQVGFINDVPISNIVFAAKRFDFSKIDFSSLTNLKVDGDLNFSEINSFNWTKLASSVVMKSQPTIIPGVTIVEGDLIAKNLQIDRLNGLQYPRDYILENNTDAVELKGNKKFHKLTVGTLDLDDLKTINGIPIEEYVTLFGDRTLTQEITFENFSVTEALQHDGKTTGLPDTQNGVGLMLNATDTVTSDVVFAKLTVLGDLRVENSINGTNWSTLDDLVSKEDQLVEITGSKTFLKEVVIDSELTIKSQMINGHPIQEFVTVDTEQVFPNLDKISGNVTLRNVARGDLESLRELLSQNVDRSGQPQCLDKSIVFKVSPIVEHLFIYTVNKYSSRDFSESIKTTFAGVIFQNLEVLNLKAPGISLVNLNGMNFEELRRRKMSKTKPQTLTGDYDIELLETDLLDTRTIDDLSIEQLENTRVQMDDIYNGILNGSLAIDTVTVGGIVSTVNINGESLQSIYSPSTMGTVTFPKNIHVENLQVLGFVNGINFTEFLNDAVLKNDSDIVITGHKVFNRINCKYLHASEVHGRPIDHILDPSKHQVLSGSMKVNGTVKVLDNFETPGKIGGVSWEAIQKKFHYLGNNTYILSGDLWHSSEQVDIENLVVFDSIQGVRFNKFLDTVVYKNSKNFTISGPVIFEKDVTIDGRFTITEKFNDLNLKHFYDHAVRVDRPLAVKSKVVFTRNIAVEEDLLVNDKLEAKTVGGVDLSELYANAAYVDRPSFISGTLKLENVIFERNIQVENLNDMDLRTVITYETEQILPVDSLHCFDITVGKRGIAGRFNGHDLNAIYSDTFQLTGDQNISGHIIVVGDVLMRHDFDASFINKLNPAGLISLDGDDTLIGNFVFEKPLILHGNFLSHGPINDIDVMKWQATAMTKSFPLRQTVKGGWTIHGNVHFEKNVLGSELLDGVNVTELVDELHRRDVETELVTEEMKSNLHSICEDLTVLADVADNQIYKYKYFDYLNVLNFDRPIVSVHHFESNDFDYLLVNFDTCHLDIFVFTGTVFSGVTSIPDIGLIERWFTLHFEDDVYFLTVGKYSCNKNSGNLWRLTNDQFLHVADLGNVTDAKIIGASEFLLVVDDVLVYQSIMDIYQRFSSKPRTYEIGIKNVKFVSESSQVLLVNRDYGCEFNFANGTGRALRNCYGTDNIVSFRLGIYRREYFLYYDESLSEDYLFISEGNLLHRKILQSIKTQQPTSALVLNFDGFVENLLILVENRQRMQIYEYRGIEGFTYRETIDIKADRIIKFQLRKYSKLAKQHCIAAVHGQRLVILEAKMYGKKLDMESRPCGN